MPPGTAPSNRARRGTWPSPTSIPTASPSATSPDYHLVLTFLDHGWLTLEEMESRLTALLPRFSMQTIQQDPAEFRRKYKGLLQMARAVRPGAIHRL
jgi:hypothetical protein